MNRAQAIEAIEQATDIFVYAPTSRDAEGRPGHSAEFRITKVDALAAMLDIGDSRCMANIHVAEQGRKVVIGMEGAEATLADLTRASEFSHNDNNNGNF